jgi:Tol biopolymer transport system component/DNA-binding winged helix-turn-helix (wHTH) protein
MMPNDVPDRVRFGAYEVDLHTHELWKHGLRLKVVGQPFEILAMLLARPGQLVTREELRARLWPGDTFVDFNHGLNAAVNKLREALSDSADEPRYIETLPRRGYRFVASVELAARGGAKTGPAASLPPVVATLKQESEMTAAGARSARVATKEPVVAATSSVSRLPVSPGSAPTIATEPRQRPRRPRLFVISIFLLVGAALVLGIVLLKWFISSEQLSAGEHEASLKAALAPAVPPVPLTNLTDPTGDPAFSPDGTRVAFFRQGYAPGTSGIFVKPLGSLQLLQLTDNSDDCCPVWSPNGRSIAFSRVSRRVSGNERTIYEVPSGGGALRKLHVDASSERGYLDWSPDGNSIAFSSASAAGTESIFLLSLKDLTVRRITQPPLLNRDRGPAFSPDGESLAFIRKTETGLPEMIVVMPTGGGEIRVLLAFHNGIVGPPAWTADNQSILFSTGEPALFRIPASGGDFSEVTAAVGPACRPAASRRGYRLAYQKISAGTSLWQMNLSGPGQSGAIPPKTHGVVVTDTGRNEGVQVSPDGKKLAFMSNRSGSMEIWTSKRDGSDAIQLSAMGLAGTPRWSPDGHSIAFDRDTRENGGIFVVNADGGSPRPLVQGNSQNLVPSWSHDGKWVYFASDRTGSWQVWRVSTEGGSPVQVTAHGGFAAYESRSGRALYYSKLNMPNPEIWRIPVEGGVETQVSTLVRPDDWANWALLDRGIFFVQSDTMRDPVLMFFDFSGGDVQRVAGFDRMPFWLSAAPDGKSVLYEHLDQENSHVMLLENFH